MISIYPFFLYFLGGYLLVGVVLFLLQKWLIFQSRSLSPDHVFHFEIPFREVNIALGGKDNLNLIRFYVEESSPRGLVLYFHGNRDNVERYAQYASHFTRNHYEVWMVDFPGYGKSTGRQTEENFYFQAREAFRIAQEKFPQNQIILYGKSLGSGVASYLAKNSRCKRLVLETPYFSMPDLMASYAPIYPARAMTRIGFPVGLNCAAVQAPISILAGRKDRVIPYRCTLKIRPYLKTGDEFLVIPKGTHHNLSEFPEFHQHLAHILSQ
ncbi:MAG: alpha/beta fold hydrolase [Bacteroidota bacterium]|nr:alpha/beta fold hydrolase [Bacteroidota bacterium]